MTTYTLSFQEIDKTKIALVGGKGANLGELTRIEGSDSNRIDSDRPDSYRIHVPDGFCITTEAFKRIVTEKPAINKLLDQFSFLKAEDRNKSGSDRSDSYRSDSDRSDSDRISEVSREIRRIIEETVIPEDIHEEISHHLSRLGEENAYAVRSSATAEDLPTASFAGQQDTYLNIFGREAILKHIGKCWASLFTDRAIIYRMQNGFDHRQVHLSVVVQKMVFPRAAGILFTADPVTGNRKILSIDASLGLGEALVSGLVNPDIYKVLNGKIIDKKISAKKLAVYASKDGGTKELEIEPEQQNRQALTDDQILQLERIGRTIENHFGHPQDIEWCLLDDRSDSNKTNGYRSDSYRSDSYRSDSYRIYIVQSRPITTLYPIPDANDHDSDSYRNHVYISVGHQQMMTDPMKPLGLSLWQLTSFAPMHKAGGRLFVDVTKQLYSPHGRNGFLNAMGQHDPLIKDALNTIIERTDYITTSPEKKTEHDPGFSNKTSDTQIQIDADSYRYDRSIVSDFIKNNEKSLAAVKETIQSKSGTDLLDFIQEDIQAYFRKSLFDPQSMGTIMAAINASLWINEKTSEWLGEKNVADTLSRSVAGNITSEMGLELLDVADVIRSSPEVIEFLQNTQADNFLDELPGFEGGREAQVAIVNYLNKYGMRCSGEIDITRTRWSEKPAILIPMILSHIKTFEPGESNRKFQQGQQEALKKEEEILAGLKLLPDGEQKASETRQRISLIRNFSGYREYPKYALMSRYFVYKHALLKELERFLPDKDLHDKEDIYFLTFQELREAIRTNKLDHQIINQRKEEYKLYEKLIPPRVITSDGEIIVGKYKRENLPAEAIVGLAVSSGPDSNRGVEGRARVILNMADADLEDGDILVTVFTDPSWTPLFVSIKGLVTEVGGLMTHGAVIAREYGIPAVVGVENATKLIKDKQRIRVHGTEGYVEIL